MAQNLKLFFLSFLVLPLLDIVFFSAAGNFYKTQLSTIVRLKADGSFDALLPAAAVVYLCLALSIVAFVLPKAAPEYSYAQLLLWGGFFGFTVYGVYEMTNFALLKDWTLSVVIVDMLWGTVLCGLASLACKLVL